MRVLDIITEAVSPLETLRMGVGPTTPLSSLNHRPNQVTALKQELSRHRLVTGFNQRTGERTLGGMAWTGPVDDQWTPQLDNALVAWKTSINLQISGEPQGRPFGRDALSPTLSHTEVDELINTRLGSDGLLDVQGNGRLARRAPQTRGPLEGETYRPGVIEGNVNNVTDVNSMISEAGFSVWFRIAVEIMESRFSTPGESWLETTPEAERNAGILNKLGAFYGDRYTFVDQWLQRVRRAAGPATAVYLDGTEEPIAWPGLDMGSSPVQRQDNPVRVREIFNYYTNMAMRLWEKDTAETQDAREQAAAVSRNPVTAVTLDETTLRAMATALRGAFDNDLLAAVLPGGRTFSNDIEAIESIFGRINTAADYDNFAQQYSGVTNGRVLHEDFYQELSKDDYMRIFHSRLLAIRRIAPRILHGSINFGEASEITVEYEGRSYDIQRERDNRNNPVIDGYDGENDYDSIVIDNILRLGVQESGGSMPDFDRPPAAEAVSAAQLMFISTIQQTYPEMTAFYVRYEPFDQASADLGGMRLRGIIDDVARMGDDEVAVRNYITNEIADDREWLVGSDDGSIEPAANIRFDERYSREGLAGRDFPTVSADEDVELNANEDEILENIRSPQESIRREAIDALLQTQDPATTWDNIYRVSARQNDFLDESDILGGRSSIEGFVLNGTDDNSLILRVIRQLGLAQGAPRVAALMFHDAMDGLGTTESTIEALIGQIQSRNDYELIDERYVALEDTDDSLIDDLASEQFAGQFGYGWYGRLAEIIGDERRLDMIRVELPRSIMDAIENIERAPTEQNLQELRTELQDRSFRNNEDQLDLVIDRLNGVLEDLSSSDDQGPTLVLGEIIAELQEIYDNL